MSRVNRDDRGVAANRDNHGAAVSQDQTVAANLPRRTGVTLNEWILLLRIDGPDASREERIEWLMERHGLGTIQATVVVSHTDEDLAAMDALSIEDPELRPLADRLISAAQALGVDVRLEAKEKSVPLVRHHEFAAVRAGDAHRLDLQLALPGHPLTARLQPLKKKAGTRFTHHVEIARSADVDAEVMTWLRQAHELDA